MASASALVLRPSGVGSGSQFGVWQSKGSFVDCGASLCHSRKPHECRPLRIAATPSGSERRRVVRIRCRGSDGGAAPPESRDEAIAQAAGSVSALLEKALKRRGPSTVKQRKEQRQVKLRVEVPVPDDTPASLVSLTLDLVSALKPRDSPVVAVFFPDASAVALARSQCGTLPDERFHCLQSEREVSGDVSVVLVAGASYDDTERLRELARNVNPRPVVVLNPDWSPEAEQDARCGSFLTSFEAAYAFLPLAIQGFFSKTEGAVLKNAQSGAPWLIFVKENGKFTRLSSLKSRPGPAELESALYNAMAANSAVTKSIKFLRGLVSKE